MKTFLYPSSDYQYNIKYDSSIQANIFLKETVSLYYVCFSLSQFGKKKKIAVIPYEEFLT